MAESKFKIWLKSTGEKAKEWIGPLVVGLIPGLIICGTVTALHDSRRIGKLEKRLGEHIENNNRNVDVFNEFADRTKREIEKLTRQNNELLERALRETEGKAS